MDERYRIFLRGTALSVVGTASAGIAGYLTRRILANGLELEEYAFFYSMQALLTMLFVLAKYGSSETVFFLLPGLKQKGHERFARQLFSFGCKYNLAVFAVISLGVALAVPLLQRFYFPMRTSAADILLFIPFLLICAMETFSFSALNAVKAFGGINVLKVLRALLMVGGMWALLRLWGCAGAIAGYILPGAVVTAAAIWILWRHHGFRLDPARTSNKVRREFFTAGGSFFILTLSYAAVSDLGTVVLTVVSTAEEVAIFNIALPVSMLVGALSAIPMALVPLAAEAFYRGDCLLVRRGIRLVAAGCALAAAAALPVFWLWGRKIIALLFDPEYADAQWSALLLVMAACFLIATQVHNGILNAVNHRKATLAITYPVIIPALILLPAASYFYGAIGTAATILLLTLAWAILSLRSLLRVLANAEANHGGNRLC